jgi:hypothetical protein
MRVSRLALYVVAVLVPILSSRSTEIIWTVGWFWVIMVLVGAALYLAVRRRVRTRQSPAGASVP